MFKKDYYSNYSKMTVLVLAITGFVVGNTSVGGRVAWAVDTYFNSVEPGCNGSDPNVLMCDDFESGTWYTKDCDAANSSGGLLQTKGWCGSIYANPITPPGAAVCGNTGVNGSNCAATSGFKSGGQGGRNMADHDFVGKQEVDEVFVRYYYKVDLGYVWGHEKTLTFNQCCAGIGGIKWGNVHFPWGGTSMPPAFQFTVPEDLMQYQNVGTELSFQPGNWYFIEVRMKLNTPGQRNGVLEMWLDNCGSAGTGCTGTPTKRMSRTNVLYNRSSTSEKIGSIWWENWANPGSTGTNYIDQIKVSKVGPIGFAGQSSSGTPLVAPNAPSALSVQ